MTPDPTPPAKDKSGATFESTQRIGEEVRQAHQASRKDESEATAQDRISVICKDAANWIEANHTEGLPLIPPDEPTDRDWQVTLLVEALRMLPRIVTASIAAATQGLREELAALFRTNGELAQMCGVIEIPEEGVDRSKWMRVGVAGYLDMKDDRDAWVAKHATLAQELADEHQKFQHYSAQMVGNVATLAQRVEVLEEELQKQIHLYDANHG